MQIKIGIHYEIVEAASPEAQQKAELELARFAETLELRLERAIHQVLPGVEFQFSTNEEEEQG